MLVTGHDRNSGAESGRWCVLRCFTVVLVLIALTLAVASRADAHSLQTHWAHGGASTLHDLAPDTETCCDDQAEAGHGSEGCSVQAHCLGCTVVSAAISAPELLAAGEIGLRMTLLPTGLGADPAGHPPKAALMV
jgi:hypothetical protein